MKNISKILVFAAAAAATLVSCKKNEIIDPNEGLQTVNFTVRASLGEQTKTYITETDGNYAAKWSYNSEKNIADKIGVFFGAFDKDKEAADATFEIVDVTDDVATFSGTGTVSEEAVTLSTFYPAEALFKTYAGNKIGLSLKKSQNAVLGSFDPAADILIGKQKDVTISTTDVLIDDLQFARLMSILRVNVLAKNASAAVAGKTITSLKLSAPGVILTGTASVSAETGEIAEWTQKNNEVIANIDEDEMITVNEDGGFNAVYVVVNPTTIPAGTKLTFTVETSDGSAYTRTVTAPEMVFDAASVNEINLTLRDSDLSEDDLSGSYIIASKGASGNWAVMSKTLSTTSSSAYFAIGESTVAYDATVDFTSSAINFGDFSNDAYKWTLAKVSGGYSIKNADNKYLGVTAKTKASLNDDAVALKVAKGTDGIYSITNADASLALKYNSGSPRFTFYDNGQTDVYLIPFVEACAAPVISCVNNTVTITTTTTGASIYYTVDGTTEPTSSSTLYSEPFAISENTTVKAIAIKSGAANSLVTTKACDFVSEDAAQYVKVTSDPTGDDWSGTYLILNTSATAFNGNISTTTTKYGLYESVTVSDNKIASTSTVDAYAVTIDKSGDYYTIKTTSGNYLYWTSGNSLNANSQLQTQNKSLWSISNSDGTITISNANTSDRKIRFNNDRFACYTSNTGTLLNLYKKSGSSQGGGETPETKYAITLNSVTGGTIKAYDASNNEITEAAENDVVTIVATADDTHTFGSWSVTGAVVANANSATTTFAMPASAVTIDATFNPNSTPDKTVISIDFTSTDQRPSDFPSASSSKGTTLAAYTIAGYSFSFYAADGYYWTNTTQNKYLIIGKQNSYILLPAVEGKKLTKVEFSTGSSGSANVIPDIYSADGKTAIYGNTSTTGAGADFEWDLSDKNTVANTSYQFRVTSKHNIQLTTLKLTYAE